MTSSRSEEIPTACDAPTGDAPWSAQDDVVRLDRIDDFLVETKQFSSARRKIVRLFKRWKPGKDGRLIIVHGPSGSGKTTVADAVLQEVEDLQGGKVDVGAARDPDEDPNDRPDVECHEDDEDDISTVGRMPPTAGILKEGPNGFVREIIKVFVEPRTRSNRLLRDIVRSLGIKPALSATYGELVETLKLQIAGQRTRMIILDEIHHMLAGQGADVIKVLLVQVKIQVVGIGLPHAKWIATETPDDDLERHLHAQCPMGAFDCDPDEDGEWTMFLATLAEEMPFDVKPDFAEAGMSVRIHAATDGLVGKLMSLIEIATEIALDEDLDSVDAFALDEAYRQIHDVGKLATPFSMKDFSTEKFAPVRKAIRARNVSRKAVETAARARLTAPDFRKR